MIGTLRKHLSPALVISVIALFAAIGGVAGALPGAKQVDGNDLKKNVVKSKNIGPNQVRGVDVNEASLGAVPEAGNVFGVSVSASGTVTRDSRGGTTVNKTSNVYRVTFTRRVVDCVPVATAQFGGETPTVPAGTANPNSIDVTGSTSAGGATDIDFHLMVIC